MIFNLQTAKKLDAKDPIKGFRKEFHFPKQKNGKPYLYFTGNSLGLQPKKTRQYIVEEIEAWAKWGVEGHFHARRPWLPYHEFVTNSLAKLVGAHADEVVAMNSLTTNLHLLFSAFYRPDSQRNLIMVEENAFSSDLYALGSQLEMHQWSATAHLLKVSCSTEAVLSELDRSGDRVAIVWLGQVNYQSGYAFDLAKIAKKAHEKGCLFGVDLAHGIGNLRLNLHDDGVDFATWCSYKYLNSGPGGISGIYVNRRHAQNPKQFRLAGWWGHDKASRFEMGPRFHPILGAEGFQLSNPPIFQLAALRASLDLFDRAKIDRLRKKSVLLTGFLELGLRDFVPEVEIVTPPWPELRGAQLSLRVRTSPSTLVRALNKLGVICDSREPDILRVAPAPLYNSFSDVFSFVQILRQCLQTARSGKRKATK